jgi:hypothetical protein
MRSKARRSKEKEKKMKKIDIITMVQKTTKGASQMYGMSGSGPPASCTRLVAGKTTTNNPSGVAVGSVLTSGNASTSQAKVIEHIIGLCGVPCDSTMVEYNDQQQWEKMEHVVAVELEEFKDIYMVRSDGATVTARPLKTHLCMLKFVLLWFKWNNHCFYFTTSKDDFFLKKNAFDEYIHSEE